MSELILPKTDVMLSSCKEVDELCAPLNKLGIHVMSYTRTYEDSTFIDITNIPGPMEELYYNNFKWYKYYAPDISPEMLKGEFFFCSVESQENQALNMFRDLFSIKNILVLFTKRKKYYELFNFCSYKDSQEAINLYLNNLNLLNSFRYYFLDKGAHIIRRYENDRMLRLVDKKTKQQCSAYIAACSQEGNERNILFDDLQCKRYYVEETSSEHYLTEREVECIAWCAKGKSNFEIAILLNISNRTVEAHLNKAKEKLNCHKQTDLVRKAIKLDLID